MEKKKVTVTFEVGTDEDGIPDVTNVTVDGQPADRLSRESRGITAAWDIYSEQYWGLTLQLGSW